MVLILFLVDTSASMNQKTYLGTSYLDVAKVAIETFMKYRSRDAASRGDKYMLVSFDEPSMAVKSGWMENHLTFISELKNLQACSLSTFGASLKEAFDLLNVRRLQTGIDHYGQGRNPFFLEPAVVIALTDGGKLTNSTAIEQELSLFVSDGAPHPEGCELTKEVFRWDQRLFTVLMRLPGLGEKVSSTDRANGLGNSYTLGDEVVSSICEATGGKCYVVSSQKSLMQCMENLTQKLHPGVVVNFQKIGGASPTPPPDVIPMEVNGEHPATTTNSNNNHLTNNRFGGENGDKSTPPPHQDLARSATAWYNTRRMIFIKYNPKTNLPSGFWPIPESFWPDYNTTTLPPRDANPVLLFDTVDVPPLLVENFPFDKYELEPSPLTQFILGRRNPNICWQVYVNNSGKQKGLSQPFGYLKASTNLTHVTLFVMPYNFPTLLPLIEELIKCRFKPNPHWKQKFAEYIATVPPYYAQPLRNALRLMGAPTAYVPDSFDGQMSYTISNYLRKLKKQAKVESERAMTQIVKNNRLEAAKRATGIVNLGDGISLAIGSTQLEDGVTSQSFRNPYDISRTGLLDQLARMRTNFLHATPTTPNLVEDVVRHQVPIGQMGNYQEHLKKINPLREVDSGSVRTQLFGNPFKLERPNDNKMKVDTEMDVFADEHMVEMNRRQGRGGGRRHARLRLSRSPTPSPPTPPLSPALPSTPPTSSSSSASSGQSVTSSEGKSNSSDNRENQLAPSTHTANGAEAGNSKHTEGGQHKDQLGIGRNSTVKVGVMGDVGRVQPAPFTSSALPDDKTNAVGVSSSVAPPTNGGSSGGTTGGSGMRTPLDKVQQLSRKRERTPSPTLNAGLPNSKRPAVSNSISATVVLSVDALSKGGGLSSTGSTGVHGSSGLVKNNTKTPSPLPNARVMSSASKVLTEEIQKQQGQENARLKLLIFKEIRKPGKNYEVIFQHLESVRGSNEVKKLFVVDITKEANKFKKKKLVQMLEEWKTNLKLTPVKAPPSLSTSSELNSHSGLKKKLPSSKR